MVLRSSATWFGVSSSMHRGSIMEVTTINRVYSCGTTLRIVKNIDSVRHRARGSLVEPWASIRVVKTSGRH